MQICTNNQKKRRSKSIVLPESIETNRGYHVVCYRRFIALSQQQREKIGEQRSSITSPKSHSNAGIFPKIFLFYSSARKKVKGKEQKLVNVETSEFQEKVM